MLYNLITTTGLREVLASEHEEMLLGTGSRQKGTGEPEFRTGLLSSYEAGSWKDAVIAARAEFPHLR